MYPMGLEALTEAINGLIDEGVESHADEESVKCLVLQMTRLDSLTTKAIGAYDTSGDWALHGAKTCGSWLAVACRLPRAAAGRMVRRARHLRHLPIVSQAFENGEITPDHVDAFVRMRRVDTEEVMARDEAVLVKQAKRLRFDQFVRALAYWDQLADPDGSDDAAEERRARRDAYLQPSISGMYLGQMTLDPVSGAIVSGELKRIESEFFKADWRKAREELGREPTVADLWRTPAQRRADSLVEMATRSAVVRPEGRRPAPLFSVLVDWPTLSGRILELADGVVVSPSDVVDWLGVADLERAVMEPSGRVEVSPTRRLFSGATRRALELRDRECAHPFCDTPADLCQADHIDPFSHGGLTTQDNGRLLCGFHNRLRNHDPPPDE
jgi:Domain of unknown function (DUF222)